MKYIFALLIVIIGLAVLIGICVLIAFTIIKVQELHYFMEQKYKKYRKFCETMSSKIVPAIFIIFIGGSSLFGIIIAYCLILKLL